MKILSVTLKRSILLLLIVLATVYGSTLSKRKNKLPRIKIPSSSAKPNNNTPREGRSTVSSTPPPSNTPPSNDRQQQGYLEFQTKILIVCFSMFMLVFVLILLVIGHFTWFAEIRRRLEEEWEQELKAEEERRQAKSLLDEMRNPFENAEAEENQTTTKPNNNNNSTYTTTTTNNNNNNNNYVENDIDIRRRESLDSSGCARGRCVPPHHSILCPNNRNIPSLTEPLFKQLRSVDSDHPTAFVLDPIEYRNQRSSTEWMNLERSVRVSEPVPVRESIRGFSANSAGLTMQRPPMTPEPLDVDVELGRREVSAASVSAVKALSHHSPVLKFDLSKLDMF